jgi:tetratricopeptide (TPR) repeat protein
MPIRAAHDENGLFWAGRGAMTDPDGGGGPPPEEPDPYQMIIHAERGSAVYAVLHGDMHIRNGHPVYQIRPFPAEPRPISRDEAVQQPSRLLAAERQVVPFTGRDHELAVLASWRDDPAPGVSVMLLHGPGGQGKTRLATRFAADCVTEGWTAWTGHHLSDPVAQQVAAPGDPGRDLVLIVDYADRWPVDDLLLLLTNPLLRRPQRARVLLLARTAGPWWPSVRHRLGKAGLGVGPTMELPPLAETTAARRGAYVSARDSFAVVLGISAAAVPLPRRIEEDAFRLVLTVHMAALAAVDACRRGATPPEDPVGLSAYLLDRERDFWHALHDHGQIAVVPTVMGRAVYTAMVTGQLPRTQGVVVLERAGIADRPSAGSILDDHAQCYPSSGSVPGTVLEPLHPDRFGEDFLALATPGHSQPEYPADPWAEAAAVRLLVPRDHALPCYSYTRSAMTTLIEAGRRWPHIVERQLNPLLRERPQLAVDAGGGALAGLADLPGADLGVLEEIEVLLPVGRHVDLDAGMAALSARLTPHRLSRVDDPAQRADLYHALGKRLSNAGLFQEALAAATEAVEIREQLAASNPGRHEPALALSLNNLGTHLGDLGRHEEASAAASRAVELYRQLPQALQAAHEPELALALNNLAGHLALLGRFDDALTAALESAQIRQRLAAADPAHEAGLAQSVTNLGVIVGLAGRREYELKAAGWAAQIWARLAGGDPAAHGPDFAMALTNLAAALSGASQAEQAGAVAERAVAEYRRLTRANEVAHEPGLATALSILAVQMSALGRVGDALAAIAEAIGIRDRLAADNPAAYGLALATALDKQGAILADAGRLPDALTAIQRAAQIRERLLAVNPAARDSARAESWINLGKILDEQGRTRQAAAAARRAVKAYRALAAVNPATYEPGLALALGNLGMILLNRRHPHRALEPTREGVAIYRRLASVSPAAAEADLARALWTYALVRAIARKELPAARGAVMEAIGILERLAEQHPAAFSGPLLAAYGTAAEVLDALGEAGEAAAIRQLVELGAQSVELARNGQ